MKALAIALGGLMAVTSIPALAEDFNVGKVRAYDGDTVIISVRMVGYDTPESGSKAKCEKERELAKRATERLRELLQSGKPSIEFVHCSCKPGTEGTIACNFGRACGVLKVNGEDVGPILIQEGLAREYNFKWDHRPPRADWCSN